MKTFVWCDEIQDMSSSNPFAGFPQGEKINNLRHLEDIGKEDAAGLKKAAESYGDSWKKRGGANAFFMLCRKWDRLENQCERHHYDIFAAIVHDERSEGIIDDLRDLRRYLMLVESEMRERGCKSAMSTHRDNEKPARPEEFPSHRAVAEEIPTPVCAEQEKNPQVGTGAVGAGVHRSRKKSF